LVDTFRLLRDTTCYLAWLDGRPVGGDCLAIHGDVASLFGSATVPTARGRGVQSALLADHLRTAALLGCRLMIAGAAPGGVSQRNMERLGFRVAYTDVMLRRSSCEGRRA
jgi:GNAT superfamily N-acetyltransferase